MSIMMNPVLPVAAPELPVKPVGRRDGFESSFARHLDRQINEKYGRKRDKLGVDESRQNQRSPAETRESRAAGKTEKAEKTEKSANTETGKDSSAELPDLLGNMMNYLKQVAETKIDIPGEWNLELADGEMLRQLSQAAGMDEADFSQFMQQLENSDTSFSLVDFLGALNSHFDEMAKVEAVTVPETEFPMLEAILAKMGISQEDLNAISAKAVSGDGKIDLNLLMQALDDVGMENGLVPVTLSDWESEQMQNLLDLAGVTLEKQNEILPERFLNQVLGRDEAGNPVILNLERLQNMLRDALASVRDSQPKVDLPVFLSDLQQVIAQAEFQSQSVGWTPVVEESVNAVFQKLQELVDLARVKVEENNLTEDQALDDDTSEWFRTLGEKFAEDSGDNDEAADFAGNRPAGTSLEEMAAAGTTPDQSHQPASNFVGSQSSLNAAQGIEAAKNESFVRNPPRPLEQHVFQQISDGVIRGLRSQEHQLVLRLYPQDLGEVKVNLLVRDDHVSVSFNMENAKVKEMLESTMEEFKQSLDQKGFKLGECFVSVGQQDDNSQLWQRFEMARNAVKAARATLVEIPENALYLQADPMRRDGREDGISLIV
ncbi:MAG: flagellar hook-length control protein FliK [Pseudomonadota bacterium]